jgi:hypothetical protein
VATWQTHNTHLVNFDVTTLRVICFVRARFWVAYGPGVSEDGVGSRGLTSAIARKMNIPEGSVWLTLSATAPREGARFP